MKQITSCGFLIQCKDKYLLCHPSNLRTGKLKGDKGWGLPKGKLDDEDKDGFTCALREVQEETNLDLLKFPNLIYKTVPVYTTTYLTTFEGERVSKTVHIYYVFDESGILEQQELSCPSFVPNTNIPEMDDYRWVIKDDAKKICMRSLRDLFENVNLYVHTI